MTPCGHILYPLCSCDAGPPPPPLPEFARQVFSPGALIRDLLPPAPPEPPPAPPPLEETHAGPAPRVPRPRAPKEKKGKERLADLPWVQRAKEAQEAKDRAKEELEQQIMVLLQTPEGREQLQRKLDVELARKSFAEFFRQAWKVLEPSTELIWNWHLSLICGVAQAVFFDWLRAKREPGYINKVRNVLVNLPPGTSKSRVLSVCFQAWAWLHWPGMKFICLSVNDDAAMRDARAMRELVRSKWYTDSFNPDWSIKSDQDAISNYGNTSGGERLSMPSRSVVVGVRGDALLIDDANDPSENIKERAEVNQVWDTTQYNRVNDPQRSMRFGVQQRTGGGDWSEHVLERQGAWSPTNPSGWLHVVLPAEYESSRRFVLPECLAEILREHLPPEELVLADPRTYEGESIDLKRLPKEVIADERKRWEGTGHYAAQMQQRPAELEGARVKRDYWGWCRLEKGVRPNIEEFETGRPRPANCHDGEAQLIRSAVQSPGNWDLDWIVISLDCAAKKTDRGSNWGILVIAGKAGKRYVLDDRTRRGDILEIIEVLRDLIKTWRPDKILIEDKAAGPDLKLRLLAEMSKGDMPMIMLEDVKVGSDGKEARLDACISVLANGFVFLLDGAPWLEDFVDELALFPHGTRSDRVDSLTQALNHFKDYEEDCWPED